MTAAPVDLKAIEAAVHRAVQAALADHLHPRMRLTIPEAAAAVGVSKARLYQAIKDGKLQAARLGGDGDMGVSPAELRRWALGDATE